MRAGFDRDNFTGSGSDRMMAGSVRSYQILGKTAKAVRDVDVIIETSRWGCRISETLETIGSLDARPAWPDIATNVAGCNPLSVTCMNKLL